jgi:DNA-binding transcriptional ArsR family regulator
LWHFGLVVAYHFDIIGNMKKTASSPDTSVAAETCLVRCFHPLEINRVRKHLKADGVHLTAAADRFKALGNAKRLTILQALRVTELCVCDIAHLLGLSVAATSQQLRQLRIQGWIVTRSDGKMVYCQLSKTAPLRDLDAVLQLLDSTHVSAPHPVPDKELRDADA